jgi:hypothetical protein
VTVFLPLMMIGPVMLLLQGMVVLAGHGPLGWVAAAGLLAGTVLGTRWLVRAGCAWWASTKAPERW